MKERITVKDFVTEFKTKKIQDNRATPHGVSDFIKEKLDFNVYVPFMEKRRIINMVVEQNMSEEHGIVEIDSVGQFVSFLVTMMMSHTTLDFSDNPIDDYDLLCEAGLIEPIVEHFKKDYDECSVLLSMICDQKLKNNNLTFVVSKFLDGILDKVDGFAETLKGVVSQVDLQKLAGTYFEDGDLTALKSFIDKIGK